MKFEAAIHRIVTYLHQIGATVRNTQDADLVGRQECSPLCRLMARRGVDDEA